MKIDRIPQRGRAPLFVGVTIVCAGALLSGCMSSPTYGTGKSANAQLVDDLTGILSVGPRAQNTTEAAYTPRPGLVRPGSVEVLPEPQQQITASGNVAWPESPEERRARIRAEATANQENPFYRSQVAPIAGQGPSPDATNTNWAQRAEMQNRIRERNQGDSNARRYLSEPPLAYRRPADTAAYGELGEDERTKERRLERQAGKTSGWRSLVPWL